MTKDVIEWYDRFNTKGCPDELIFGNFSDQPIPSNYHNFLKYDDDDGNNFPGTPVDNDLLNTKGVENSVLPNFEYINYDIIMIDDDDRLESYIDLVQKEMMEIEGVDN